MDYFAGLDVSVKETSVCILDDAGMPDLAVLVEPLLVVRRVLRQQLAVLHRRLLAVVRDDEVCRRLNCRRRTAWPAASTPCT